MRPSGHPPPYEAKSLEAQKRPKFAHQSIKGIPGIKHQPDLKKATLKAMPALIINWLR